MKKVLNCFLLGLVLLCLICGCQNDSALDMTGVLSVSINDGTVAKGIAPTMDIASYRLTITQNGQAVKDISLEKEMTVHNLTLAAGEYTVTVDALTAEDHVIGSGSANATVAPQQKTTVSITVTEAAGEGTFQVSLQSEERMALSMEVLNASGQVVATKALVYEGDSYGTSFSLGNGFYEYLLKDDTGKIIKRDSVRIYKDVTTTLSVEIDLDGSIWLTIVNTIQKTPTITLSLLSSEVGKDGVLVANAQVAGLVGYEGTWSVDFENVPSGAKDKLSLSMADVSYGDHTLTYTVRTESVVWSQSVEFSVKANAKSQTIAVDGDVEVFVTADVLIPYDLLITYFVDGEEIGEFDMPSFNDRIRTLSGVLSVELSGVEGYTYYLETQEAEDGHLLVAIVIDKEIANPGYLHVVFNQDFVLEAGTSRGFFLKAENTDFESKEDPYFEKLGHISVQNYIKERTLKVEPDTYRHDSGSGSNAPDYYYPKPSQGSYVVAAGEVVEMVVTRNPYAAVELVFPEPYRNSEVLIADARGRMYDENYFNLSEGDVCSFGYMLRGEDETFKALLWQGENSAYFTWTGMLTEGKNTIVMNQDDTFFEGSSIIMPDTTISTSRYRVKLDANGFLCPVDSYLAVFANEESGIQLEDYRQVRRLTNGSYFSGRTPSGGGVVFVMMDDVGYTYEVETQVSGDYTEFIIKLSAPEDSYGILDLNYQDIPDEDDYYHSMPMVSLNGGVRFGLDLSARPTSVKALAGSYGLGGSYGNGSRKYVYFQNSFQVTAGNRTSVALKKDN